MDVYLYIYICDIDLSLRTREDGFKKILVIFFVVALARCVYC